MAKSYRALVGFTYPKDAASLKKAQAGKLDEVEWAEVAEGELVEPPYPGIVASWQANGVVEEVTAAAAATAEVTDG